jgi:UDP-glucose 4-epimerase
MPEALNATFHEKRVLITGGLGFIGSNLAGRLVSLGADVTLIDSLAPDLGGNLYNIAPIRERVHLVQADLGSALSLGPLVRGMDVIFNLAGQGSHLASMREPGRDLLNNSSVHLAFLEICRQFNPQVKIIYASTRQVYGRPRYIPVDENHPLEPVDYNGVSKLAGEMYHLTCHRVYGMRATCLRLTNVYGPRMRLKDGALPFIAVWFKNLLNDKTIRIFGNGQQIRDFNFVDDVVDAFLMTAANPLTDGQVYNLGSDQPISLLVLAQRMIAIHGKGAFRLVPFPLNRQRIDIGSYQGNYSKLRAQVGWQPRIPLDQGIRATFDFYLENRTFYV